MKKIDSLSIIINFDGYELSQKRPPKLSQRGFASKLLKFPCYCMIFFKKNNVKLVLIIKMQNGQLLILAFEVLSVLDPRCSVPILKSLGGAGAEWVCDGI